MKARHRPVKEYLSDIINNINRAISFVTNIEYEDFIKNDEKIYTVVRAIEIIGEAANKIPQNFRQKYNYIPWNDIVGMRNKIVHEYFEIDLNIVWNTVKKELPELKQAIQRIMEILKEIENNE